jgi:hypothetical protein
MSSVLDVSRFAARRLCGTQSLENSGRIMKQLKAVVITAAIVVFGICAYTFLLGNKVFEGKFDNDVFAWYFLAKGIFCSLALYLWVRVLEALSRK